MIDWGSVAVAAVSAVVMLAVAIAVIRVNGLRSLSKMAVHDFVVTVALGSVIATTVAGSVNLPVGVTAFVSLIAVQRLVALLRRQKRLQPWIDNKPLLLMRGDTMVAENLASARVTEDDVIAKLREANVTHLSQVMAVVLESTGDVSVLHGSGDLDPRLMRGVQADWPESP